MVVVPRYIRQHVDEPFLQIVDVVFLLVIVIIVVVMVNGILVSGIVSCFLEATASKQPANKKQLTNTTTAQSTSTTTINS